MTSYLESLKCYTKVVADTGDIDSIVKYAPEDATTNPSLILKAAKMAKYRDLVKNAVERAKSENSQNWLDHAIDVLSVSFGIELLQNVPGRVSTEVDAGLSFDIKNTVQKAIKLISMYESEGINRDRVLIKIAATWEGIKAAEELERKGINCNLTLIFNEAQAIACAESSVFLISPFVGRILDWYVKETGLKYSSVNDPGVMSVSSIYNYFKLHGYKTIVMGASFRNIGEIVELCGCDRLTISPELLEELASIDGSLVPRLSIDRALKTSSEKIHISEAAFRWMMNEDPMANEKLSEGIRKFNSDLNELRNFLIKEF